MADIFGSLIGNTGITTSLSAQPNYSRVQFNNQLAQNQTQRAQEETARVQSQFSSEIGANDRLTGDWQKVKSEVGDAASAISSNVGRAKGILAKIDSLISTIEKADQEGVTSDNSLGYARAFDSILKSLNLQSEAGGRNNLLGSTANNLSYRTGLSLATNSVSSSFGGSSYELEEDTGEKWIVNEQARNIKRFDEYPTPEDPTSSRIVASDPAQVGAFDEGLTLVSIDDTTGKISFTINANTADPTTYNDVNITRNGLELLNAWAYDNFSTEAQREAVMDDLNDARSAAKLQVSRLEAAFSVAQFYEEVANSEIGGLRAEKNETLIEQAQEVAEVQQRLQREFEAASGRIAMQLAIKNEYGRTLFGSLNVPGFFQPLLNLTI